MSGAMPSGVVSRSPRFNRSKAAQIPRDSWFATSERRSWRFGRSRTELVEAGERGIEVVEVEVLEVRDEVRRVDRHHHAVEPCVVAALLADATRLLRGEDRVARHMDRAGDSGEVGREAFARAARPDEVLAVPLAEADRTVIDVDEVGRQQRADRVRRCQLTGDPNLEHPRVRSAFTDEVPLVELSDRVDERGLVEVHVAEEASVLVELADAEEYNLAPVRASPFEPVEREPIPPNRDRLSDELVEPDVEPGGVRGHEFVGSVRGRRRDAAAPVEANELVRVHRAQLRRTAAPARARCRDQVLGSRRSRRVGGAGSPAPSSSRRASAASNWVMSNPSIRSMRPDGSIVDTTQDVTSVLAVLLGDVAHVHDGEDRVAHDVQCAIHAADLEPHSLAGVDQGDELLAVERTEADRPSVDQGELG